jgi:uncharacterized protein YcbX
MLWLNPVVAVLSPPPIKKQVGEIPSIEPLKTLSTFRRFPGHYVRRKCHPEKTGTIKVGDPITVI